MTAVDPGTRPSPPVPGDPPSELAEIGICPYLAAVDGAWRSTTVAREHRCGAVAPPAILAAEKQRRLCLTGDYLHCATFEAARATRPNGLERAATLPRPLARTTPVVLDHGRISVTMPGLRSDRFPGQAVLIILLGVAFAAIAAGPTDRGRGAGRSRLRDGRHRAISADASAQPTRSSSSGPSGSADPSSGSSSSPAAGSEAPRLGPAIGRHADLQGQGGRHAHRHRREVQHDPQAIAKLNGLNNPSALQIGQVLQIP